MAVALGTQPVTLTHVLGHATRRLAAAVAYVARGIVDGGAAAACPCGRECGEVTENVGMSGWEEGEGGMNGMGE